MPRCVAPVIARGRPLIFPQGKIQSEEAKEARERIIVISPERGISGFKDADMVVEVCILYVIPE